MQTISLEQVAKMFQTWRKTKSSKFAPTPNSLKTLVKQLLPLYSKSHIIQSLGVSSRFLKTIIKPTASSPRQQQSKRNPKTNPKLRNNRASLSTAHNQDISFMPFTLGALAGNTTPSNPDPAALVPPTLEKALDTQDRYQTQCEFLKPNGMRLVIHPATNSDLISIISTFLCSN